MYIHVRCTCMLIGRKIFALSSINNVFFTHYLSIINYIHIHETLYYMYTLYFLLQASHAESLGAAAIGVMPPTFFKPQSLGTLHTHTHEQALENLQF